MLKFSPETITQFLEIISLHNIVWSSIDWVYSVSQAVFAYNLVVKSFEFSDWLFDNNFFFLYEVMIRFSIVIFGFEFFMSSVLDSFFKIFAFRLELTEDHLRRTMGLLDPTMFALFHPSSVPIAKNLSANFILRNFIKFQLAILDFLEKNSLIVPLHLGSQLMASAMLACIFIAFFCSFFSKNKEEFQADMDYSIANMSAEAEKELFAIDDATCLFLLLFFMFVSYFGFFAIVVDVNYMEFLSFFASVPFVVLILLLMPCNLIFDFGTLFVAYLRGVANTSSFFFELVYDYIGVAAFFTRLFVQFVRIILMFVVYCMMHDAVILHVIPLRAQVSGDSFWEEVCAVRPTLRSVSYFFVIAFPARCGYWIYEVLHTFFVVTVQFSAFFTIIFWLFLLFYTFFIFEEYECYFNDLRRISEELSAEMEKVKQLSKKNKSS